MGVTKSRKCPVNNSEVQITKLTSFRCDVEVKIAHELSKHPAIGVGSGLRSPISLTKPVDKPKHAHSKNVGQPTRASSRESALPLRGPGGREPETGHHGHPNK